MRTIIVLLLLLLLVTLTGACQTVGPSSKVQVELSDFAITPQDTTVLAGKDFSLTVTNSGIVNHDLRIMKYGADVGGQFDEQDSLQVLCEANVPSGESITVTCPAALEPGEYQVVCSMPGHMQAGMTGTLTAVK